MTAITFPNEPIDGRVWHSHRRYPGLDHGCEWEGDHGSHREGCAPHAHVEGHLIDIGLDCGIEYGPALKIGNLANGGRP